MRPLSVLGWYPGSESCPELLQQWQAAYEKIASWGKEEAKRCSLLQQRLKKAWQLREDPDAQIEEGDFPFGCEVHHAVAGCAFTIYEKALMQCGLQHLVLSGEDRGGQFDVHIRRGFLAELYEDLPVAVQEYEKSCTDPVREAYIADCRQRMRQKGEEYYRQAQNLLYGGRWKELYYPLSQAADHLIPDAMVEMGLAELYGHYDFRFDRESGIRRLQMAAQMEDMRAAYALVEAYDNGNWLVESADAKVWCEQAAAAGHLQAQKRLNEGFDPRPNILVLYDKAHAGDPWAQYMISFECCDETDALRWIEKSAEGGYIPAMNDLAQRALKAGHREQARGWYLRSAESGIGFEAMLELGNMALQQAREPFWQTATRREAPSMAIRREHLEQLQWYEQAALAGAEVEDKLCMAYHLGYPVLSNQEAAFDWAQHGAQAHRPAAIYWKAYFMENGLGTQQDIPGAVALYEQAAEGGIPAAMLRLYEIYRDGLGEIPADPVKASHYRWMSGEGHS